MTRTRRSADEIAAVLRRQWEREWRWWRPRPDQEPSPDRQRQ